MPLRFSSKINGSLAVSALIVGLGVGGYAVAASPTTNVPPVQTYADQALPPQVPAPQQYYDSPLAAGTLTLQDVLEAHKPAAPSALPAITNGASVPATNATAPLLTPPVQSSSTSLMMSEGMKSVLQKVGGPTVPAVQVKPPSAATQAQALGQPVALTPAPIAADMSGFKYEPGQAPKNLAGAGQPVAVDTSPPSVVAPVATVSTAASSGDQGQSCGDQNVQKWEKSCSDAGYPASYLGKIVGETRTGCSDGTLHDVWVSNSCAPPDAASSQTEKIDGVCGSASNKDFENAPTSNLCGQGIASAVNGDGPWTWACSGVNGGAAAACTAPVHVAATNGVCGDANGVATSQTPAENLCHAGTATSVKGNGPWNWSCKGNGLGRVESCIAPLAGGSHAAAAVVAAPVESSVPVVDSAPVASAPAVSSAPVASAASSDKGELCGPASETLAYEAPSKDLCRVGNPSVVNGDGPWSWACTDNEGVTSSCRTLSLNGGTTAEATAPIAAVEAPAASVASSLSSAGPRVKAPPALVAAASVSAGTELACGAAAAQPALQRPSSDLCVNGKVSGMHGKGPWSWTCGDKSHHKVSCETPQTVDGQCGPANGAALKSTPFAGLCAFGTPSGIEGDGPWTWTCNGNGGGVNVSCGASVQGKEAAIDGQCGSANSSSAPRAPTANLCVTGTASDVSGEGPWSWSCSGSNGGKVDTCAATKVSPPRAPGPSVSGSCGVANGVTTGSQPTDGLCAAGVSSSVVGNGPWNWNCSGENGGMTVSCTAPLEPPAPIDGACGRASGVPTLVRPEGGLCDAGITGAVNGRGPWTWTCSGANGGNPASCIAPIAGKSAATPSVMKAASDDDIMAAPAAAPSGLVTPRLPGSGPVSSLDKKTLPSLTPSKSFDSLPAPTPIPPAANVTGDDAPLMTPDLPPGSQPVQPPAFSRTLPSAPVLEETPQQRASAVPGNHLTLDPTISTVLFERGSGNIGENVLSTLDKLVIVLQSNPDVRISLIGYADNDGSTPRDARRLSLTRALAVRDYLSSKGISESRVDVHAEGANTTSGYIDRIDVKVNN